MSHSSLDLNDLDGAGAGAGFGRPAPLPRTTDSFRTVPADALNDRPAFLNQITDVPASAPTVTIPVAEAGISKHQAFFRVASFVPGSHDELVAHGDITATAALGAAQRGVHMSRLVESVQEVADVAWPDLDGLIRALVIDVARRQQLDTAQVSFDGVAQIRCSAPVSGRRSLDSWGLHSQARMAAGRVTSRLGLTATIMTACPCTRMYSWYSTVLELADQVGIELANQIGPKLLTFTHSQRATVQVDVDGGAPGIPLSVCYEAICASSHVVHELLKRPDEHALVRQAHERPQFTEDVVREVAAAIAVRADPATQGGNRVSVTSSALESIHGHTVCSRAEGTVAELLAYMPDGRHAEH
jgi:GTP cyclohydrolase IV